MATTEPQTTTEYQDARTRVAAIIELAYPEALDDPRHARHVADRAVEAVIDAVKIGPQYNVSVSRTGDHGAPERIKAESRDDAIDLASRFEGQPDVERVSRHHRYCSPWHRTG